MTTKERLGLIAPDGSHYVTLTDGSGQTDVAFNSRFIVAAGNTVTRPANTDAYTANDAVANNATAGSVTPFVWTVSETNDFPISIERIRISTTDTGAATKNLRMFLFNATPTPGAGDNATFAFAKAGFIGTVSGALRATSDGSVGVLTPDEGARIIALPESSGKRVWGLLQTLDAFTPSANSTTFTPTIEGFQGRA